MNTPGFRVLLVDDDEDDLLIVQELLAEAGGGPYSLEWAADSQAARAALAEPCHDVVLVDYRLGPDDGLELIRELVAGGCKLPLILLTGRGGPWMADEALGAGAADYLPKTHLDADSLSRSIRHAVFRRRAEDRLRISEREARRLALVATHTDNAVIICDPIGQIEWVNAAFTRMTGYTLDEVLGRRPGSFLQGPATDPETVLLMRERIRAGEGFSVEVLNYSKSQEAYWLSIDCQPVRGGGGELLGFVAIESDVTQRRHAAEEAIRARAEIEAAYDETIEGWARALDLRDHETEGHSRRVTEMTVRLARALGHTDEELIQIRRGALLHDIGKMGIPDSILRKPGPLDDHEWAIMKRHPVLAMEMLSPIGFLRQALEIPHCHHEKWDGTGYPQGLRAFEIPLSARIFAAVDIWDALSNDRPYRKAMEPSRVREHLRSLAGSHLDPAVVATFLPMLDDQSAASERTAPTMVEMAFEAVGPKLEVMPGRTPLEPMAAARRDDRGSRVRVPTVARNGSLPGR